MQLNRCVLRETVTLRSACNCNNTRETATRESLTRETVTLHSPNHRDNALAACCRLMMAGADAAAVPPSALLQALLPALPLQGDVSENETALAAICWLFARASDAGVSGCLLQCAQQIVVAVARTMQFYGGQSDVQLGAQTQQQVLSGCVCVCGWVCVFVCGWVCVRARVSARLRACVSRSCNHRSARR